jgi:hypothetical protein
MDSSYHSLRREERSWLSFLNEFEFGFSFYFVACVLSASLLLIAYTALAALWFTGALDSHLFSLDRINAVTQIVVGTSQAFVIVVTTILCFAMEALASDAVFRRSRCI